MKLKNKKITVLLALILAVISVFGTLVSAADNAGYEFSVYGSGETVNMTSADVLEEYLGTDISSSERDFFDTLDAIGVIETVELSYNKIINTNKAELKYESGKLFVKAFNYEYTGVNGKSFVWIPESVTVSTQTAALTENDGVYEAYVECAEPENNSEITISYRAEVEISREDINEIINLYLNSAEYASDKAKYDAYLVEKKLYDDAKAKYEKYLSDMDEYERLLYAYNNYENETLVKYYEDLAKYQIYEVDKKEYDAKMEKYNAYMAEYNKIKKQLDAVKLIDVPMAMNRTVYSAVMGGAVDQVLENETLIVAAGADEKAVFLAGDATERVRSLMKGFKACKTDAEKYMYYTANYENFCESFLTLTQTLDILYRNSFVRASIYAKDRNPQYLILVAQLALISNALIDGPIRDYNGNIAYDANWTIDNKTIAQILEHKTYFVDDNTGYPIDVPPEVKKPADLVEMKKPVYPPQPEKPIIPTPVSAPGNPPSIVKNPDNSQKQPQLYEIHKALGTEYTNTLKEAFENGTLPQRRNEIEAERVRLTLNTVLKKNYGAQTVNISFKMQDGSYKTLTADANSPVVCEASVPFSYVDENGDSWVLKGWKKEESIALLSDTGEVDMTLGFEEDTTLVPVYEHYYSVSWNINGTVYTKSVSALADAVCPVKPEKADIENMCYDFAGWEDEEGQNVGMEIGKPTRDATYTATFEQRYIVPLSSTKGAAVVYEDGTVICDATKHYTSENINISALITRAVQKQSGLIIKLNAGTLKFAFSEVLSLEKAKINTIGIEYSGGPDRDNYLIRARDENQNPISMLVEFTGKTRSENTNRYKLYKSPVNADKSYVLYSLDGRSLTFEAQTEVPYVFRAEYSVRIAPNDLVNVVLSNSLPEKIEKISYSITAKPGVEILEILIDDADGEALAVTEEGSREKGTFWVVGKDVTISVMARYKTYTVTFKANGKNIYQTTAEYGSEINPPTAPKIGDDGVYSYKFVGWNQEITPVTCDVIYEAVYEKTLIPVKEDTGGIKISSGVKKLLLVAMAAFLFFIALIALIVVIIVKKLRARKAKHNGYMSYAEYSTHKRLLKSMAKLERLNNELRSKTENPEKAWKLIKNAEQKRAKAQEKFTKATNKRISKDEKLASKREKRQSKKANKKL